MADRSELLKEYKTLAKKADRRLRTLEEAAADREGFKPATQWAYASAMKDIEHRFGEGANRFDRVLPEKTSKAGIEAAINEVKSFLDKNTSTITGIKSVYKDRADQLNEIYGTDFKWQDMANFFNSGTFDKLNNKYGSDLVFVMIAQKQKQPEQIIQEIRIASKRGKRIPRDQVNEQIYEDLLQQDLTQRELKRYRTAVKKAQSRRKKLKKI